MVELVTSVINYALPRAISHTKKSVFWLTRLRVAIEALSRLVLRLTPEKAEDIFNLGLGYYRTEGVAKRSWLYKVMDNLLARSWETLPKNVRSGLVLKVLSAPISGLDGFDAFQFYPDTGGLLVNDDEIPAPIRTSETEASWAEIVQMIIRGLRSTGEARKRAAVRLVPLTLWGSLTRFEQDLVAQALWQASDNLPLGTSLNDWMFILLPEPEPGIAEQRFRKKWLGSQELKDGKKINEFFWYVGTAIEGLKNHNRPLILSEDESNNIIAIIEDWIKLPVTSDNDPFDMLGSPSGVEGLQSILPKINLPPAVAESLFAKVSAMNQLDTPGFRLYAGLSKSLPNKVDEIAMSLRKGLAADNLAIAEEAIIGLHGWLSAASDEAPSITPPPDDLLREIGVVIATRRKGVLIHALKVANWVFTNGSNKQRDVISQMALDGLRYLIEELRYDREHSESSEVDIPLLRYGCAHLALAMSICGFEADPTVTKWAEVVQNDPLPEVRHAKGSASVRLSENNQSNK